MSKLNVIDHEGQLVVDSRLIAEELGIDSELLDELSHLLWDRSVEYLSAFDLLAIWLIASYDDIKLPNVVETVDKFYFCLDEQSRTSLHWLKHAVISEIAWCIKCRSSEQGRVHAWFSKNFKLFIPNGELVKFVSKNKKRPDFLIKIDGIVYPVECKLTFNKPALIQLQGYIKTWDVSQGFAVAPKTTCDLPTNISFIQCP
ncbi:MAG: hypothetical protein KME52_18595 [Desmonostoc geniculatum HA4340-LM1]|jgi:sRNA-binding regulator protein Hfq|nr:hypothetical protein [Desmonostoc geniculatum HA4340-LM1]